jgi:hypothetical protein
LILTVFSERSIMKLHARGGRVRRPLFRKALPGKLNGRANSWLLAALPRRPLELELLEPRRLLDGTLNATQVATIQAELGAIGNVGQVLGGASQLAQPLAGLNASLNGILPMQEVLTTDIANPADTFLSANQSGASVDGLEAALANSAQNNTVTCAGSVDGSGNATFNLTMDVTQAGMTAPLIGGEALAALGITGIGIDPIAAIPVLVRSKRQRRADVQQPAGHRHGPGRGHRAGQCRGGHLARRGHRRRRRHGRRGGCGLPA